MTVPAVLACERKVNWKEAPVMGSFELAAAKSSSGFNSTELILIVVVVIGFYMLLIRPQRRRAQQAQQQQNSLRPGARVTTTAGMRATVIAVDDEAGDVVLEVSPGVEVRFMKRAIMSVDTPGDEPEETEEADDSYDSDDAYDEDAAYDENAEGDEGDEAEEGEGTEDGDNLDGSHEELDDADATAGTKD